VATCWA